MATASAKSNGSGRPAAVQRALKRAFNAKATTGGEDTVKIRVCAGTTCNASGRAALVTAIAKELEKRSPAVTASARRAPSWSSTRRASSTRASSRPT